MYTPCRICLFDIFYKIFFQNLPSPQKISNGLSLRQTTFTLILSFVHISEQRSILPFILFRFPSSNPDLLKSWIMAMKWKDWTPTKYSVLCEKHFKPDDYICKGERAIEGQIRK